jgi:hypothetical protein
MDVPTHGHFLSSFIFVDDLVIVEQDAFDLEFMLKRLHKMYNN